MDGWARPRLLYILYVPSYRLLRPFPCFDFTPCELDSLAAAAAAAADLTREVEARSRFKIFTTTWSQIPIF